MLMILLMPSQIVTMDPKNCEWHLCLHLIQKFRRGAANKYSEAREPEKESILKAMKCPGAQNDPRVITAYVCCLADTFRNSCLLDVFQPFTFESDTFISADDVVRKIRALTE